MEKTNYMLNYLLPIIGKASPDLRAFLERWILFYILKYLFCVMHFTSAPP